MTKEIPLQHDMFSGELVDTRTASQKRQDRAQEQPKPLEMFSQRETAQFGVTAHPYMPISEYTRLALQVEDHRSPEEIGRDTQREAERQTIELFPSLHTTPTVQPESLSARLVAARDRASDQENMQLDEDAVLFAASQALQLPFSLF